MGILWIQNVDKIWMFSIENYTLNFEQIKKF